MKKVFKNIEVRFDISTDCIDTYVNDKYAGDFTIEEADGYMRIRPSSFDLEEIGFGRQGVYTFIIDTILEGDLNDGISDEFENIRHISFESVLRTEKACRFWSKRGYDNIYDKAEHESGNQKVIEIIIL